MGGGVQNHGRGIRTEPTKKKKVSATDENGQKMRNGNNQAVIALDAARDNAA